jgi:hypothetical protein
MIRIPIHVGEKIYYMDEEEYIKHKEWYDKLNH